MTIESNCFKVYLKIKSKNQFGKPYPTHLPFSYFHSFRRQKTSHLFWTPVLLYYIQVLWRYAPLLWKLLGCYWFDMFSALPVSQESVHQQNAYLCFTHNAPVPSLLSFSTIGLYYYEICTFSSRNQPSIGSKALSNHHLPLRKWRYLPKELFKLFETFSSINKLTMSSTSDQRVHSEPEKGWYVKTTWRSKKRDWLGEWPGLEEWWFESPTLQLKAELLCTGSDSLANSFTVEMGVITKLMLTLA